LAINNLILNFAFQSAANLYPIKPYSPALCGTARVQGAFGIDVVDEQRWLEPANTRKASREIAQPDPITKEGTPLDHYTGIEATPDKSLMIGASWF
jgi:hypothetical protein